MRRPLLVLIAAAVSFFLVSETWADPPPWAPAHGYRNKGKGKGGRVPYYVGYSGREYDRDYDIIRGRCDREKVGAVLGGVVGGVIGNDIGGRDNRVVATILGAAAGALIGARIGRSMDNRDRACWGHALELGTTGRPVQWINETDGRRYELTPGNGTRDGDRICRDYTLVESNGQNRLRSSGTACQAGPGEWQLVR
ncbi:MAG TPA: glycine zipper 2TM domain-containing protein [Steroidobacteraceae bacterium]|nr:glycine zipper 2TM domain-containing protein [Steroidobacteraceae bacterium]